MQKLVVGILTILIGMASPAAAEEYFFDSGFYVGLGANANHMSREKEINYGFVAAGPLKATDIRDWAASPTLKIGYKFGDANSVSLYGDWAHYSLGRSIGGLGTYFFTTIDGTLVVGAAAPDLGADIDWKSDVFNVGLEYQRKLWSDQLGGVSGLLGFKYRYERQKFEVTTNAPSIGGIVDDVDERLREHLYGPYAGMSLSFKPAQGSNLGINLKSHVGYLFKSAELRAREGIPLLIPPFAAVRKDHSSEGTVFATVGLDLIYAINKNWSVGAGYEFNWINRAAHIFNNDKGIIAGVPSKIENSSVYTSNVGMKVFYKF